MRQPILLVTMLVLMMSTPINAYDTQLNKEREATGVEGEIHPWTLPEELFPNGYINEKKMPENSAYADQVILGNKIINETSRYIGPTAEDEAKRFAGSNLSCASCHARGGTVAYQSGFVGVYSRFPQFRARSNSVNTLEDRINGCMQRSLNGKPLPSDSQEMRAMITYMQWLSQSIPVGAKVEGEGLIKIDMLDRAADPKNGEIVYNTHCVACHQADGSGFKNPVDTGAYYIYPPVWGEDSYNNGAGMYRLMKAAAYIKQNMPNGNANLTTEEAYDVAAYINSQPRPEKPGLESDFPERRIKPVDAPYPPFEDGFTQEAHKYGPYQEMIK